MTTLFIDAVCGLGNRLRALKSTLSLAADIGADIELFWGRGPGCNCAFERLFERPPEIRRIHEFSRPDDCDEWASAARFLDVTCSRQIDQIEMNQLMREEFDFCSLREYESVLISTHMNFHGPNSAMRRFRPACDLTAQIESCVSDSRSTIGVHIRRSDNRRAEQHSPTELFIARMRQEAERDDAVRFFLATDDVDVESRILQEFGDVVRVRPGRILSRSEPQGIRDAAVDLFCLSRCSKVLGSYWSSFSWAASAIGGIPLSIISNLPPEH